MRIQFLGRLVLKKGSSRLAVVCAEDEVVFSTAIRRSDRYVYVEIKAKSTLIHNVSTRTVFTAEARPSSAAQSLSPSPTPSVAISSGDGPVSPLTQVAIGASLLIPTSTVSTLAIPSVSLPTTSPTPVLVPVFEDPVV